MLIFFIIAAVLFLIAWIRAGNVRDQMNQRLSQLEQEIDTLRKNVLQQLNNRLTPIEKRLAIEKSLAAERPAASPPVTTAPAASAAKVTDAPLVVLPPPAVVPPTSSKPAAPVVGVSPDHLGEPIKEPKSPEPVPPKLAAPPLPPSVPTPRTSSPLRPPVSVEKPRPVSVATPQRISVQTPRPISVEPRRSVSTIPSQKASVSWTDLESRLGGNWLNKIGVGILVIGVSLLIGYTFQYLGAAGKVAIGYLISGALLAGGVWLERKKDFSLYGKGLIGGGWALAYFTTYALHFIQAVRLVESEWIGLTLLVIVAAGMIAHSLKYRSQIVTALAYFLGFTTVAMSHVDVFSLTANLLLAVSLVVICIRFRWFYLELAGVIATYGSHLAWLSPLIEVAKSSGKSFDQFWPSAALLALCWILFLLPNFLAPIQRGTLERVLQGSNILNAASFLTLMAYQARYPQWRFHFMVAFGTAYILLAALSRQTGRRNSYLIFTTLGVALLIGAIPMKFSGDWVSMTWLLESEVLLLAGFILRERYFRGLSWISFILALVKLLLWDPTSAAHFYVRSFSVHEKALTYSIAALCFYANHHFFYKRFRNAVLETEFSVSRVFTYAASTLLGYAIFLQSHASLLALSWCALAAGLLEIGRLRKNSDLRAQGFAVSAVSLVALAINNFDLSAKLWIASQRLWTASAFVAIFYYLSGQLARSYGKREISEAENLLRRTMLYAATTAVAALIWFESPRMAVAVAWCILAAVLLELGRLLKIPDLRAQGFAVSAVSLVALVTYNFDLTQKLWVASQRLWTVSVFAAIFYYLSGQLARSYRKREISITENFLRRAMLHAATAVVVVLMWFESPRPAVAVAWCILAAVLLELGRLGKIWDLRAQGFTISAVSLMALVNFNFYLTDKLWVASQRLWTVSVFAAIFYYLSGQLARSYRKREISITENFLRRAMLHAATAVVVVLMWFESPRPAVAVAWCLLAAVLLELGRLGKIPDLRAQGFAVSAVGLVALVNYNFYLTERLWIASQRLWTVTALAAIFYYLSGQLARSYGKQEISEAENFLRRAMLYAATTVVVALMWFELPTLAVAVAWGFLSIVLIELGRRVPSTDLRLQGHIAGLLAFGRLLLTNLTAEQVWNGFSLRLLSVGLVILYFHYLFFILRGERSALRLTEGEKRTPELFSFLAMISTAALCRFELTPPWVAPAWALLAVVYLLIGTARASSHFRLQGYALVAATMVRATATNLNLPTAAQGAGEKILSTASVIALVFACHAVILLAQRRKWYRLEETPGLSSWFEHKSLDVCFYSAALLLIALTFQEAPRNLLTIYWGVEGLILFVAGMSIRQQSFRLFGLGLLLLCTLKIFFYDLRGLDTLPRIFSFIILGLILLLVSFLYTRFSTAIKRYL